MNLLSNMVDFMRAVKRAALDAVEQSMPVRIMFGRIESLSPLQIRRDAKTVLSSTMLVQTASVAGTLAVGDRVALLRMQGGQRYLILDRVV